MPGYKRDRYSRRPSKHTRSDNSTDCTKPTGTDDSPVNQAFLQYKELLDAKHDKHEALVKISRDVTIESKRVIFHLHRSVGGDEAQTCKEAEEMISKCINLQLYRMATELENVDWYKHTRAITAGLQEFVEAYTFYYLLRYQTIPEINHLQQVLTFSTQPGSSHSPQTDVQVEDNSGKALEVYSTPLHVPLSQTDYILGIADLTGELMRLSINSIGWGDMVRPTQLCSILQNLQLAYKTYCSTAGGEMGRKIQTLKQSVAKVENACYTVKIRGSEVPKHMLVHSVNSGEKMPAVDPDSLSDWL